MSAYKNKQNKRYKIIVKKKKLTQCELSFSWIKLENILDNHLTFYFKV